jgi:hypothetical protein
LLEIKVHLLLTETTIFIPNNELLVQNSGQRKVLLFS